MSVRFDASADNLQRTANLPSATGPFTLWGWFNVASDVGGSQVFFDVFHAVNFDFPASLFFEDSGGTGRAGVNSYENGLGTFNENYFAARPNTNEWWFWAVVTDNVGATVTGYISAMNSNQWSTASVAQANPAGQSINTVIHSHSTTDWTDHRAMYCGMADRAYSQAELYQQKISRKLVYQTSINTFCRNETAALAGKDVSGNGRDWTVAGTLSTDPDVPLPHITAITHHYRQAGMS